MVTQTMADKQIPFLTRAEFCRLTDLEINTFRQMRQRGQVPLVWRGDASFIIAEMGASHGPVAGDDPEKEAARGYTAGQAFCMILAGEFFRLYAVRREVAAFVAAHGNLMFSAPEWRQIAETSAALQRGEKPDAEIFFGSFGRPNGKAIYGVGRLAELAADVPDAIDALAVSVTRVGALMRERAAEHNIDISNFWTDPV